MACSALIVDDDPIFVSLATRILEKAEVEVVATAGDAASALAAATAARPDAALVDVGLPDCGGIDLAYQLAALPWAPRVVLTSTDSDAGCAIDGLDGRAKLPFIPKEQLASDALARLMFGR
jgi:DNA-binding NarL/FixJ family response regulator